MGELTMDSTSASVKVPHISASVNKDIVREKGFFGIEARTNVELEEISNQGLSTIDISEIPDAIDAMASNTLLLG
jgi:hypothetical protein